MAKKMRKRLATEVIHAVDGNGRSAPVLVAHYTVAQTFLSAVSQVFQPARRWDNSNVRLDTKPCRQECRRNGRQDCLRYISAHSQPG